MQPLALQEVILKESLSGYSASQQYLSLKTRSKVPYLPVHSRAEMKIFNVCHSAYNKDWKSMAQDWNRGTLRHSVLYSPEPVQLPAPSVIGKVYRKFPEQLEAHLKPHLRALERRSHERLLAPRIDALTESLNVDADAPDEQLPESFMYFLPLDNDSDSESESSQDGAVSPSISPSLPVPLSTITASKPPRVPRTSNVLGVNSIKAAPLQSPSMFRAHNQAGTTRSARTCKQAGCPFPQYCLGIDFCS